MVTRTLFATLPSLLVLPTGDALSAAATGLRSLSLHGANVADIYETLQLHASQLAQGDPAITAKFREAEKKYIAGGGATASIDYCRALSMLIALEERGNTLLGNWPYMAAVYNAEYRYWNTFEAQARPSTDAMMLIAWAFPRRMWLQPVADRVLRVMEHAGGLEKRLSSQYYYHAYAAMSLGRFTAPMQSNLSEPQHSFWATLRSEIAHTAFVGTTALEMQVAESYQIPMRIFVDHERKFTPPHATHRVHRVSEIPALLEQHGW